MNPAWPLTGNPIVLQRLANLYLVVFWAVTAFFYLSLVQAGYDSGLALLACTCAGLAFALLRLKQHADSALASVVKDEAWQMTETGRTLVTEAQLLIHLHDLFRAESEAGELGLTLVTLRGPDAEAADARASDLVRRALFRETDSRIFEMDSRTFAFAARHADASKHLDALAEKLESEMQTLRDHSPKHADYRVNVGMTVASTPECSTTDLLVNARASRRFAEAHGHDRFICKV